MGNTEAAIVKEEDVQPENVNNEVTETALVPVEDGEQALVEQDDAESVWFELEGLDLSKLPQSPMCTTIDENGEEQVEEIFPLGAPEGFSVQGYSNIYVPPSGQLALPQPNELTAPYASKVPPQLYVAFPGQMLGA